MLITLNGAAHEVAEPLVVADLLPADPRGSAVSVNGEVVPRDQLATHRVRAGDRIEVVTAVQGG